MKQFRSTQVLRAAWFFLVSSYNEARPWVELILAIAVMLLGGFFIWLAYALWASTVFLLGAP